MDARVEQGWGGGKLLFMRGRCMGVREKLLIGLQLHRTSIKL